MRDYARFTLNEFFSIFFSSVGGTVNDGLGPLSTFFFLNSGRLILFNSFLEDSRSHS